MARANPLLQAFNAGEFSPRMAARLDFSKYAAAGEIYLNGIPVAQGPFARRASTRFVAAQKSSAARGRLLPFEFSTLQAYMVEAGDGYFRFYRNQARIDVVDTAAVITNGGFEFDISGWDDISSGGGANISHDAVDGRLNLNSDGVDTSATEQDVTINPSNVGKEHVLRFRVVGVPGDAIFFQVGSTTGASDDLDPVELMVGFHSIAFTPSTLSAFIQFSHTVDKTIKLDGVSLIDNDAVEVTTPWTTADIAATKLHHTQSADELYLSNTDHPTYKLQRRGHSTWSVVEVAWQDGPYFDENITETTISSAATTGTDILMTASSTVGVNDGAGFLSTDIGRSIRLAIDENEPGWAVITSITNVTNIRVDIKRDFFSLAARTTWQLGAWSRTTGYPATVGFFEQRLVAANTATRPQRTWFSQSADIENMRPDSFVADTVAIEADDAFDYTIAADDVNAILWLSSGQQLVLGTQGGEWIADSSGAILTPFDVQIRRQTKHGSLSLQPARVGSAVLFPQRAARKIREFIFSFEIDGYRAPDLTILADHITRTGIEELFYQQEPDSLLWCLRADGVLATLSYKREEDVVGWTRQIIGGSFSTGNAVVESVAVIPGADGAGQIQSSANRDEVWVMVKRTINSVTARYVEVFEGIFEGPLRADYSSDAAWETAVLAAQVNMYYADSIITYDDVATTAIAGLEHLEGETVKVLADGAIHPDEVVTSGTITLDYEASVVQIGLGYTHRFKTLKLAYGAQAGTAVAKTKRTHRVGMILLDTAAFLLGVSDRVDDLKNVEFRTIGDLMDTAVPLFTGEKIEEFDGNYETDPRIVIESDAPSAFTLVALAPELITNELI